MPARAPIQRPRGPFVVVSLALALAVIVVLGLGRYVFGVGAPAAAPDWVAVDGPRTFIHTLARAPWGDLYAGTVQGVYASTDSGATWRPLGSGLSSSEVWGLAAYAGTRGRALLAAAGDGSIYRLDAAQRWLRSGAPIGTLGAYSLLALPASDIVLAGSDRGIFRSVDAGRSWRRVVALPGGAVAALVRDAASGAVYAGLAGRPDSIRVSRDGGRTWRIPAASLPPPSVEALLAVPGHVYAGVMRPQGGQAVWASGAGGFSDLSAGLPPLSHGMALAVVGRELLVGTMGVGVYARQPDGSWTRLGHGPGDSVISALLALPGKSQTILAGTGEGIYRLSR